MMNADVNWQISHDRQARYLRASSNWRRTHAAAPDERLGTVLDTRSSRLR
jgi:hypothetical protein